ncbi:MAG: MarR family winged helix-turn-helix transcriptional regulator [Phycisphaerales bacterium]
MTHPTTSTPAHTPPDATQPTMADFATALDPILQNDWRHCPLARELFVIHNQMMRIGDRLVADLGITASRWLLLGALGACGDREKVRPEGVTITELSQDALLSVQNVSRMVAALEADGLVERTTVPGHGRSTFVRLTDAGRALHDALEQRAETFGTGLMIGVSIQDAIACARVLKRLSANLTDMERRLAEAQSANADIASTQPIETEAGASS